MTVINGVASTGGVTSTVLKALTEIQVNRSSIGDSYTDTTGNTYAETANQTRLTTTSTYKRYITGKVSAHVGANTGTIQLYNFTTSTEANNVTTTATSETTMAAFTVGTQPTTAGNIYTLRVKNSNAGGTFTIDAGGMMECDGRGQDITSTGLKVYTGGSVPGYWNAFKYCLLAGLSTAAATVQPVYNITLAENYPPVSIGSPSSTLNSSVTVTLPYKFYVSSGGNQIQLNFTALTSQVLLGWAFGVSIDNI